MTETTNRYQVDPEEFRKAHGRVKSVLDGLFGTTSDGSSNVQFVLVDRERCQKMHYTPEPYDHRCETQEDYLGAMERVMRNLEIAADHLHNLTQDWRDTYGVRRDETP